MPSCRNIPSIPKVRASSGTIGTMYFPSSLSRANPASSRTKALVVETLRSPVASVALLKILSLIGGMGRDGGSKRLAGMGPPSSFR